MTMDVLYLKAATALFFCDRIVEYYTGM
jgi:hypothetical protein